jgi:hypothetical protein
MRLYYTGSTTFEGKQSNPLLSLGGYISSSQVESFADGSVFSSIGQTELQEGSSEIRLLALKNETDAQQTVTLYYENQPNSLVYYRMSLVAPAVDDCNRYYFEKIDSIKGLPTVGDFTDNRDVDNALTFNIGVGAYIGIWIQRIVLATKGSKYLSCESLFSRFESVDTDTTLEWTLSGVVQGSYMTIGNMAIMIDNGTTQISTPQGYESLRVVIDELDSISVVDQKIKDKIQDILVDRETLLQDGNTLSIAGVQPTSKFNESLSGTFIQGTSQIEKEKMSLIIDYEE